ncbi:MAG: gamma-glutamylcyclotransferase family protein [Chthoniobacterales bacterium]
MNNLPPQRNHHRPGPAHHDTFVRSRMEILYFAYGSNLRTLQMGHLCPGHSFLGTARLANHRLAFTRSDDEWQGGVADVLPSAGDEVWGALYRLTAEHWAALDAYEVFDPDGPEAANEYVRRPVVVTAEGARHEVEAWCYFVRAPRGHVAPSKLYRAALLEGAVERGLPADYISAMRRAFEGGIK